MTAVTQSQFAANLKRYYSFYTGGFVAFVILVGILEQLGVPNKILGYIFLFATIMLYAGIGFMSKTADVGEYYVAGRRVPALFNGMATGADWMSAASFIGMAGTLYLSGYDGLAFVLGWTGGYCLVAILLAPYLRKFGQFTIPDFLGARFGGHLPRFIGVVAAIVCSFTYVIAQIYGVGIITSRFTGLEFQVGVFVVCPGILDTPMAHTTELRGAESEPVLSKLPAPPMAVDEAVEQMLAGVAKRRGIIVIPREANLLWRAYRSSPEAMLRVNRKTVGWLRRLTGADAK